MPDIAVLFHHRWNVPVVAALFRIPVGGSRFVVLANELGAGRDPLTQSLHALRAAGIIERNPGYGHPLRPEYVLTGLGHSIGAACSKYEHTTRELDASGVAYRKWTAVLLLTLGTGRSRFNEIQAGIGSISPRSLTQALQLLAGEGLVEREVQDGFPPRSSYRLSEAGSELAAAATGISDLLTEFGSAARRSDPTPE